MDIIKQAWQEIKDTIRKEYNISKVAYDTWIEPLTIYSIENDLITIVISSDQQHTLNYISNKYKDFFRVTISEMFDHAYDVTFILESDLKTMTADSTEKEYMTSANIAVSNINIENANLNPKYKFDTFVVGSNNKFAHSASLAVAETPGKAYNPLYL